MYWESISSQNVLLKLNIKKQIQSCRNKPMQFNQENQSTNQVSLTIN